MKENFQVRSERDSCFSILTSRLCFLGRFSILEECKGLVQEGYKEVTLLGQNIDAYGRDLSPKRKFSDLLSMIGSIPGLER